MKSARKIAVRIFTEEYFVEVYIGTVVQLARIECRITGDSFKKVVKEMRGVRGRCVSELNKGHYPSILMRYDLEKATFNATLAHEASHAMDDIGDYIGMRDKSGEFRAHGIAAVMRQVQAVLMRKKGRKKK